MMMMMMQKATRTGSKYWRMVEACGGKLCWGLRWQWMINLVRTRLLSSTNTEQGKRGSSRKYWNLHGNSSQSVGRTYSTCSPEQFGGLSHPEACRWSRHFEPVLDSQAPLGGSAGWWWTKQPCIEHPGRESQNPQNHQSERLGALQDTSIHSNF